MKIQVLYYDHTAAIGGGEIALFNLIKTIDRDLVQPTVLLSAEGPLADKLRPLCPVHVLPLPEHIRKAKKDDLGIASVLKVNEVFEITGYIGQVARFIREYRFDLVHTNSLKSDIIGGIAARLAHCPSIWHVRDRIDSDYLPAPVVKVFRTLCRIIPTYLLANSEATLRTLQLRHRSKASAVPSGIVNFRSEVVHDGLHVPEQAPASDAQKSIIGLIGRISPWKGQHIFLDAAKLVHARYPDARFRIIGAALFDEQAYEQAIREQRRRLGLEEIVEFTGFRSDVNAEVQQLSMVVHASTLGEPFGQVIVEGMAARKPVVATNGGGVPEIVRHGETGLLVPMGDAPAMAEAICQILGDPIKAAEMGNKGYDRVRSHFTIERTARHIERVYKSLLARDLSFSGGAYGTKENILPIGSAQ